MFIVTSIYTYIETKTYINALFNVKLKKRASEKTSDLPSKNAINPGL
jgi:hypothetical protein